MSRSGYSTDYDFEYWDLVRWRGAVTSAIRGRRGQAFLRELIAALDAMPEKRLIADALVADGQYCAIGTVGATRGVDMTKLDPEDPDRIAAAFGISRALVCEIEFLNDDGHVGRSETPEQRWQRMRAWAERCLIEWEEEPAEGERS
jgi:hypothetical protein